MTIKFMAIYFLYGEEDYHIEREIAKLKKGLDKNFIEMSYKTYNNPKFPDLVAILRSQPMMFGKMLIVITCNDYFSKAFEDKEIKEIANALEDNNENLDIVFTAILPRGEGKKLDSRKKIFKTLSKYNSKEFAAIPTYKSLELENAVKNIAKEKGVKLTADAVKALTIQVGNNLRQIDKEMEKLKLLAYPADLITTEMVKDICISTEDLFAFSDYLMEGKKDKALLEYRRLLDKRYCMEILSTLQTMVRRWIVLKAKSNDLSPFELSKMVGQHEYVVKLTIKRLAKTPLKDLVALKKNLTEAEYRIKSGQSLDVEKEVENAFLR